MSSSSSAVLDDFAFQQLPPEPPAAGRAPVGNQRAQAESIVGAALSEAERIREVARAEGYESGRRAASVEAQERFAPAFEALTEALAQVREMRARVADEVERHAVELGLQVAEKAIAGALETDPARVVDVVRGALRCLVERERVVILVNPEDLEAVRNAADDLVRALGGIEHWEVQEERRVQRGGAMVRSASGEIDARIETKLERAREVLTAELKR
jgi:flagellar assembly protein FliH